MSKQTSSSQLSLFQQPKSIPKVSEETRQHMLLAILALMETEGIGVKTVEAMVDNSVLLDMLDKDEMAVRRTWAALSVPRLNRTAVEAFLLQRDALLDNALKTAAKLDEQGTQFIPRGHRDYPPRFQRLANAPRWIFAQGNIQTAHDYPIVGVVGTREPSKLGQRLAARFSAELASRQVVVLSGLARGIDGEAHSGAVSQNGRCIAILGHGLNSQWLSKTQRSLVAQILRHNGVILSEYLHTTPPRRENYLRRNELTAALSDILIPVECPKGQSGTAATIRRAIALQTIVMGIYHHQHQTAVSEATLAYLKSINVPSFPVRDDMSSNQLWAYLHQAAPNHDWQSARVGAETAVLQRLQTEIQRQLQQARQSGQLNDDDFDALVSQLEQWWSQLD